MVNINFGNVEFISGFSLSDNAFKIFSYQPLNIRVWKRRVVSTSCS